MTSETIKLKCGLIAVHQSGAILDEAKQHATLELNYGLEERPPTCAELYSHHLHAEIGLWWGGAEGKTLVDYDGVFELPREIIAALKERGFTMGDGIEG